MSFLNYKTQADTLLISQPMPDSGNWLSKGLAGLRKDADGLRQQAVPAGSWREIAREEDRTPFTRDCRQSGQPLWNTCMNSHCATNWLRLWRRRQVPRFEGQWACSPQCMRALIEKAVEREIAASALAEGALHRHRMPIGLVLLSQGWITREQLRAALNAQRAAGTGRIGTWLMKQCNLPEEKVTRALGMQWGCPVVSLAGHQPEMVATLAPRELLQTYQMVPVRSGSRGLAYLAFEDRADSQIALAVGKMSGLRIESAVACGSQFADALSQLTRAAFPRVQQAEVRTAREVVDRLAQAVEQVRPGQAKLVRMHQYFWLRLWRTPGSGSGSSTGQTASSLAWPRLDQVEDVLLRWLPWSAERAV
jgi:hypothetical protein